MKDSFKQKHLIKILKKIAKVLFFSYLFFSGLPVFSQTNLLHFSEFSINSKNDILFSLETTSHNGIPYKTLFVKHTDSSKIEQLTFFPEQLEIFANGSIVQVINKLGSITLNLRENQIQNNLHLKQFSVFEKTELQQNFESLQVSPSGRFISMVEPVDFVFGDLLLLDMKTGQEYLIAEKALQHLRSIKWAPDDSGLVYENNGALYFARPTWLLPASEKAKTENFTAVKIAETSIDNVHWLDKDTFYLVEKDCIYEVNTPQLLTFSLYDSILQVKRKAFSLPLSLHPHKDTVFFSASGKSLLVIKNKQHLYYIDSKAKTDLTKEASAGIPYLLLPELLDEFKVFWQDENPLIYFNTTTAPSTTADSITTTYSWQVVGTQFTKIPLEEGESFLSFSPNAKFALIQKDGLFYVKDLASKTNVFKIGGERIISSVWADDITLLVGTESELVKVNLQKPSAETLLFSQVQDFSWGQNDTRILGTSYSKNDTLLQYEPKNSSWIHSVELRLQTKKAFNANYRVYLDKAGGIFANMIYLRSLNEVGTAPLLPLLPYYNNSPLLASSEKVSKKIALIFDIMESTEGLNQVLFALQRNQAKATFFMTGSAITMHPNDISKIVKGGHQCASLFLAPMVLSDPRYNITSEFIQSGLARTEDLFYKATGAELSLFWHSPWYVSSREIEELASQAGYKFVLPTIIIPDWLINSNQDSLPGLAQSAYACINYILREAQDGSIVPIQLGAGYANEALIDNIHLLISLLQKYGYEILPLQNLNTEF